MKIQAIILLVLFCCSNSLDAKEFVVSSTADSGEGSLRQAILDANNHHGPDKIVFNIPMSDSGFLSSEISGEPGDAFFIRLASPLPLIKEALILDGHSQTRFTGDTNPANPQNSGSEIIIMHVKVDGPYTPGFPDGVALERFHQLEKELLLVSNDEVIMVATLMIQNVKLYEWPKKSKKMAKAEGGKMPYR